MSTHFVESVQYVPSDPGDRDDQDKFIGRCACDAYYESTAFERAYAGIVEHVNRHLANEVDAVAKNLRITFFETQPGYQPHWDGVSPQVQENFRRMARWAIANGCKL